MGRTLDLRDLLRRSNFPSLEALVLCHFHELHLLPILRAPPTTQLIEHLSALFIGVDDNLNAFLDVLRNVQSSTLMTSQVRRAVAWASTLAQPIHLRLRDNPAEYWIKEETEADFQKLAEIIENSNKSPLLSLYLDISLRPPFGDPSSIEAGGVRSLIEACEKRKVEVVYEKGPTNWVLDPSISQEFWRRQRELKKAA